MLGSMFFNMLSSRGVEFLAVDRPDIDITNISSIEANLEKFKPDFVINCAAYTLVDDCESNSDLAFSVNGYALENLSRACNQFSSTLIHFSTDYVFDGKNSNGYKEDDKTDPINVYGESKLIGENLIQKICAKYYIVRTSWLYGANGNNFVDTMLKIGKEKKEINVVDDQTGSPTYTKDLCEQVLNNFLFNKNIPDFGVYHITNSGHTNWCEFSKMIFEKSSYDTKVIPVKSDFINRPAKRPSCSILINTKLPEIRGFEDALDDYFTPSP